MLLADRAWLSLLEFFYPERCAGCGAGRDEAPWCEPGPPVAGLRRWDVPHLCRACSELLRGEPVRRDLDDGVGGTVPVVAAAPTGPDLVQWIGAWKYHGVRGLAWPLAGLLRPAWETLAGETGGRPALVPVPLHVRRRRERGFNQSAVLAGLLSAGTGAVVREDLLVRSRPTAQQARLRSDGDRVRNLEGVFTARVRRDGDPASLVLLDDVVTSGATVIAAVRALRRGGWRVAGVVALGAALHRDGDAAPEASG